MEKYIEIGVIGTGFIGRQHIEAIRRIPHLRVAAIVDADASRAKAVSEELGVEKWYADYHDLLNDRKIDAIHNCTPTAFHFTINKEALLKGKHVYCEKPLALSAEESEELCRLAAKSGMAAGVNFNYRHNAIVQEMRQRIRNGETGRTLMLTGQYLQDWLLYDTDFDWRLDSKMGGISRAVADVGSHLFDTAQFVLEKRIASVYAQLLTVHPVRKRRIPNGPAGEYENVRVCSEDAAFILGRFEDGTLFNFTLSQVTAGMKNGLSLTVSGSSEALEWNQQRPDLLKIGHRDTPNEVLYADPKYFTDGAKRYASLPAGHALGWHDAFTNAIQSFYQSILSGAYREGQQNYATFETGHAIMRLIDACLTSNENRQWVDL